MRWDNELPLFAVSFFICPWSIARIWPTKSIAWCYLPACVNLWRCAPKNWILPMIMPSSTVTSLHNLAVSAQKRDFGQKIHGDRGGLSGDNQERFGQEVSNGNYQ